MRYAQLRSMDISNGKGIGVALYVQGCHFHCRDCFNPETWDFAAGKKWTPEVKEELFKAASKNYIKRLSILGGEPLCNENIIEVYNLIVEFKNKFPEKEIWLYTGYTLEDIIQHINEGVTAELRLKAVSLIDYLVDGPFEVTLRDLRLQFRGSSNQHLRSKEEIIKVIKNYNNFSLQTVLNML